MNIGLEVGCLGIHDVRLKLGVYQVVVNLIKTLSQIDNSNKYSLYSFNPLADELIKELGNNFKNVIIRPSVCWNYLALPYSLMRNEKIDVFVGMNQSLPVFLNKRIKKIVVVYDLAFRKFPECYPDSFYRLERMTSSAVKMSDKIIAISETTKKDLESCFKLGKDKVKVIHPAYNKKIFKNKKYRKKPTKPFFVFIGALKKSKNLIGLVRAFDSFLKRGGEAQLVLIGSDFWMDSEIQNLIRKFALGEKIIFKGFVDDSEVAKNLSEAIAFISPAFYEGFGITYLEAMACGCPVVAGDCGATREVLQDAAMFVSPTNVELIADAMFLLYKNAKLREKMVNRGLKRAEEFSWDKFSRKFLETINEVSNS